MKIAHIKNGVVINISEATDTEYAHGGIPINEVEFSDVGIGDLYDGAIFSKPPKEPKTKKELHRDLNIQRDMTLFAGVTYSGDTYPFDDVMIAVITARLVLWQEGLIPANDKLAVRTKDNKIKQLDRRQHQELAVALRQHGESIYAASWAVKDAIP